MNNRLYIRVDASTQIGWGHMVRCMALAEILKELFDITFFSKEIPESFIEELTINGFNFEKIETDEFFFLRLIPGTIVVLDGYYFDTDYQKRIKNAGCKLVCIDDRHAMYYVADVIINYGPSFEPSDFLCETYTKLYLGLEYVLLRKPFREQSKKKLIPRYSDNKTAFVCFGGSDSFNLTKNTIETLVECEVHSINIVLGDAYGHSNDLKKKAENTEINIFRSIDAQVMLSVMVASDFAVVPASTVLLELFTVGIPVVAGWYVPNQKTSLELLSDMGLIMNCGDMLSGYQHKLKKIIETGVLNNRQLFAEKQKKCVSDSSPRILDIFKKLLRAQ